MNGTVAPVVASCAHTITGKVVGELHAIYSEIEEKQKTWLAAAPEFICPEGCGLCCRSFEPELLESEALYMASWLLCNQRERALAFADQSKIPENPDFSGGCPLQYSSSQAQNGACSIYGGRALVCRLFGYCGDTGRDGKIRFKLCKFHPFGATAGELREYSEPELRICFGSLPSSMAEFGSRVSRLFPDSAGRSQPLGIALPLALRKILMLENLHRSELFTQALETANNNNDGDNDTPNPTPNLPKAS